MGKLKHGAKIGKTKAFVLIAEACKHLVGRTFGQLRGTQRKDVLKKCATGRKPLAVRNESHSNLDNAHFAAGVRYMYDMYA